MGKAQRAAKPYGSRYAQRSPGDFGGLVAGGAAGGGSGWDRGCVCAREVARRNVVYRLSCKRSAARESARAV
jgi:hypothetical protein